MIKIFIQEKMTKITNEIQILIMGIRIFILRKDITYKKIMIHIRKMGITYGYRESNTHS